MHKKIKNKPLKELLKDEDILGILIEEGIPCLTCPFLPLEMNNITLLDIAKIYNLDLDKILKKIKERKKK